MNTLKQFSGILAQAWAVFRGNARVLLWVGLIYALIEVFFQVLIRQIFSPTTIYPAIAIGLIQAGLGLILFIGMVKVAIRVLDKDTTVKPFDVFKVDLKQLLNFIGLVILLAVIMVVPVVIISLILIKLGTLLNYLGATLIGVGLVMILGLIYLAIKFFLAPYLLIDQGLGIINSIKSSLVFSRGDFGIIFLVILSQLLLNVIGSVLLIVGLIFTMPFSLMVTVIAYRQIVAKEIPVKVN